MIQIKITRHAYKRAKERLSWSKQATKRMAGKAFVYGLSHSKIPGAVQPMIYYKSAGRQEANNIRVRGGVIFLFCNNVLVTIYPVPNKYKRCFNE